jgi:hypothetical protein
MDVDLEDDMWERSDGEEMHTSMESEPSSEGDSMDDQDDGMSEKIIVTFAIDWDAGVAVEVSVSGLEGDDSSDEALAEEPK